MIIGNTYRLLKKAADFRTLARKFSWDSAFAAHNVSRGQKVNLASGNMVFQLNHSKFSFQVELSPQNRVKELLKSLKDHLEKTTLGINIEVTITGRDGVLIQEQSTMGNLKTEDFYIMIDYNRNKDAPQAKILFCMKNSGGLSDQAIAYNDLGDNLKQLGVTQYYYLSVLKSYLHRFDTICQQENKFRIFDSIKEENVTISVEDLVQKLHMALPDAKANLSIDTHTIMGNLTEAKNELKKMDELKDQITKKAQFRAKLHMSYGLVALIGYFNFVSIGTYYVWSWDIVEPLAYFLGLGGTIFVTTQYFKLQSEYQKDTYFQYLTKHYFKKLAPGLNFSQQEYDDLTRKINFLRKQLEISILKDL